MELQLNSTPVELAVSQQQKAEQIRTQLSALRISPTTIELVIVQHTGTLIGQAEEKRLREMWNEVIGLLDIRLTQDDREEHVQQMKIMSGWLRREYPDLTCEAVRKAYNLAVKGELALDEVFSRIAPKYVGAVLSAYKNYLASNLEYSRVHQQQLLTSADESPSEEAIDQQMEQYYRRAVFAARNGKEYPDVGNGLYEWLRLKGRISPTLDEQKAYMDKAIPEVKAILISEKENTESSTPGGLAKRKQLGQLIQAAVQLSATPDFVSRVQAHAKYLYLNDFLKTVQP